MQPTQPKRQRRIVVYDDPAFYDLFMALLRAQGLTLAGWYRREARRFVKQQQNKN